MIAIAIATNQAKLKAGKTTGTIYLDDLTQLEGIRAIAWKYKPGNCSVLEWILDQYQREKTQRPNGLAVREPKAPPLNSTPTALLTTKIR